MPSELSLMRVWFDSICVSRSLTWPSTRSFTLASAAETSARVYFLVAQPDMTRPKASAARAILLVFLIFCSLRCFGARRPGSV